MSLERIREKRFWPWEFIPFIPRDTAQAIYPYIYLPPKTYKELLDGKGTPRLQAVLVHEQTHLDRQEVTGPLLWVVRYLLDKRFRYEEELIAIREQMAVLAAANEELDISAFAQKLSGYIYLRMISYEQATQDLETMWINAKRSRG